MSDQTKTVFSTSDVARICKVAPRTVSKWFDSGRLRGYRIPGCQERRIPREHLTRFLKEHGMPLGELEEKLRQIMFVCCDGDCAVARVRQLTAGEFTTRTVASAFEAGIEAETANPVCVVVDFAIGREQSLQLASGVRSIEGCEQTVVIALLDDGESIDGNDDFDEFFRKPFDTHILNSRIRTLVNRRRQGL